MIFDRCDQKYYERAATSEQFSAGTLREFARSYLRVDEANQITCSASVLKLQIALVHLNIVYFCVFWNCALDFRRKLGTRAWSYTVSLVPRSTRVPIGSVSLVHVHRS